MPKRPAATELSTAMVDVLTADYETLLLALEARLCIDADRLAPPPLNEWSTAYAQSTRSELMLATSFYQRCQELMSGARATSQLAINTCDLVLARAHNECQPVAQLPAELVQNIFDNVVENDTLSVHAPCILAVSHCWRAVALSYPRLWSNIVLAAREMYPPYDHSAFGTFIDLASPLSTDRLETHIRRARDASLSVCVRVFSSPWDSKTQFREAVKMLYSHALRFGSLSVAAAPYLADYVLPLPKISPEIGTLRVHVPLSGNEIVRPLPWSLQVTSGLRPMALHLSGHIELYFPHFSTQRLTSLSVCLTDYRTEDIAGLRALLVDAPVLRVLTLSYRSTENNSQIALDMDSTPRVPSLRKLRLVDHFEQFAHIVNPSNLHHLQLPYSERVLFRNPRITPGVDTSMLIEQNSSLHTLEFDWSGKHTNRHGTEVDEAQSLMRTSHVNMWFSHKEELITAKMQPVVIMRVAPQMLAASRMPSLAYLVVQDYDAPRDRGDIYRLMERIVEIMDISPRVRIMLISISDVSEVALRVMGKAHLSRFTHLKSAHDLVAEAITENHYRGVTDCFALYIKQVGKTHELVVLDQALP